MAKKAPGRLRKAFFAGVATLLPTVLTIFILTFAWNFLSEKIAVTIRAKPSQAHRGAANLHLSSVDDAK